MVALYRSHLLYAIQVSRPRLWLCPRLLSGPQFPHLYRGGVTRALPVLPPTPGPDGRRCAADSEPDPADAKAAGSGPLTRGTRPPPAPPGPTGGPEGAAGAPHWPSALGDHLGPLPTVPGCLPVTLALTVHPQHTPGIKTHGVEDQTAWPGCWAPAARWAGEGSGKPCWGQGEWGARPSTTSLINTIV